MPASSACPPASSTPHLPRSASALPPTVTMPCAPSCSLVAGSRSHSWPLPKALAAVREAGRGVVVYLRVHEGRGIGLLAKLKAYRLQDQGLDTLDANRALGWGADERNILVAATMLEQLGIRRVRLLTNNPDKLAALAACGVAVEGREAHAFAPNGVNDDYLATKAKRFGHLLA